MSTICVNHRVWTFDRLVRGATLDYYDPYIPVIGKTREHEWWQGYKSVDWNEEQIRIYDAVLIATNHSCLDYNQLAQWCNCIIDSRNAMGASKRNITK